MTRRNIELALLCLAAPIVVLLYAMIVINEGQDLNVNTLGVPLGMFATFVVSHLAVRKFAPAADPAIMPIAFALSGIGIAFVTRLAPDLAVRQLMWLVAGVVFMILVLAFVKNIDTLAEYKYTMISVGIILLLSPLLPVVGTEISGSRIWISFGGFSFQPGEVAKLCIVVFMAGYLAQNREMLSVFTGKAGPFHVPDLRTLLPLLIMWGISMVIVVFEKDLGSAMVVFAVFLTMIYAATGKKFYLFVGIGLLAIGGIGAYAAFSHVQIRVNTWIDPFSSAQGDGYQLCQSLFSIADGGLFGVGVGQGQADNIPVVESDFIFSAIAEETGLLGSAAVLLLYLCFAIRGFVTASRARSDVSALIATGVTTITVIQAFFIVGGVTRLIPLTGLTLPFISQGGSSLLASFIGVGLLLKCGDQGTGTSEVHLGTQRIRSVGVLGRVSLGKRMTGIMVVFSLLFAVLIGNLTYVMLVQAESIKNMPINNHEIAAEQSIQRGTISTRDGTVLARSVYNQSTGTYKREYPAGTLASQVVGYASTTYGTAGIEAAYNSQLSGTSTAETWSQAINDLIGKQKSGDDVVLTIDDKIQKAAQNALKGKKGACVVMNPKTGEIYALASSPTYNASDIDKILAGTDKSTSSDALYNRATQALYAPGSTFKMVTLATAFEDGVATADSTFSAPASLTIGGKQITNEKGASYGTITLRRAMWKSVNTVFGQLGERIGAKRLVSSSEKFGFNQKISFDLPLSESLMPNADEMSKWETAWSAIGQPVGQHSSPAGPQATVMQMALVGSAIANDGVINQPYLVKNVYDADGTTTYTAETKKVSTAISKDTADKVTDVLKGVVQNGTGTGAQVSGATVAGKTGTAETDKANPNSWFVGFAPADNPDVVVAIIREETQTGVDKNSATWSHDVFQTALNELGDISSSSSSSSSASSSSSSAGSSDIDTSTN